ncbi:MAG: type II toxin-antitoxin system prevent-host-death family antitoxin [Cyanobacteria bacterium]|nr:type II toxin-antitoxin system prevent-host-death family antitoxin [Cyanobacteriota bacterium]
MLRVGIRELKNKLSGYINKVKEGEMLIITDRNRDIAIIQPLDSFSYQEIHTLIKDGNASWSGSKPANINEPVKLKEGKTVSEIVIRDRR